MSVPKYTPKDTERFWSKVDRRGDGECWNWKAYTNRGGYGWVRWNGKAHLSHRIAYLLTYGEPGELCVLHKCDNRRCVNPRHLWLGTRADNIHDCVAKGRHRHTLPAPLYGEDHPMSKLTDKQVEEIRTRYAAGGVTYRSLAKEYGVSHQQIGDIVRNKNR